MASKALILGSVTSVASDQSAMASERKGSYKQRRTPKSTLERQTSGRNHNNNLDSLREENGEAMDMMTDNVTEVADDREEDLHRQLFDSLAVCSRQRLRAMQMILRKYGNSESRISIKDLIVVFQESQIKMTNRTSQLLIDAFEDQSGIDYERMWNSLVTAQEKTGRDSVLAQCCEVSVDKTQRLMSQEQKDLDIIRRLAGQLKHSGEPYDLVKLRAIFQEHDTNKAGKLAQSEVLDLCIEHQLPIYGALLNCLMARCDDELNGKISWPELMSFLEKGNQYMSSPQAVNSGRTKSVKDRLVKQGSSVSSLVLSSNAVSSVKKKIDEDAEPAAVVTKTATNKTLEQSPNQSKADLKQTKPTDVGKFARSAKSTGKTSSPSTARKSIKPQELMVKGRKLVFYAPDSYDESQVKMEPPKERLKMEWVYGYRGNDCRNNIHLLKSGEIVYFIGVIVVLYNKSSHTQRHYKEHSQEIMSIAVHANQITVATGQKGANATDQPSDAYVRVWRSDTLQTLHVLGLGVFQKAVICVGFSKAKDRLFAVDSNKDNTLSVWDIATGKIVAKSTLGIELVCGADFNPKNPDMIAVVGKEHLGWWVVFSENNAIQLHSKADYQNYLRAKFVICVSHNERGDAITGDSNGTVYVWGCGANIITNIIKHAHDGPVLSLLLSRGTLFTAGRDGAVLAWAWGKNMDQLGELQVSRCEGGVRMIQLNGNELLIGTTTNSILTLTLIKDESHDPFHGVTVDKIPLTQGHYDDVVALCCVKDQSKSSHVLTVGSEGNVCVFDTEKRTPLWKHILKNNRLQCADIDNSGTLLVTGSKELVSLYSIQCDPHQGFSLHAVSNVQLKSSQVTAVKISPDCQKIAVGDTSRMVYVVGIKLDEDNKTRWQVLGCCQGHTGSISAIDWSTDKYKNEFVIRSSSVNAELFFWNSQTQARFSNDMLLRNVQFASHNCTLGFSVCGIWHSKQAREADITSVDVNQKNTLIAMGDGHGYISMFRYPCTKKGFYSHTYRAHQQVHLVRFSANGSAAITTGGTDTTVMQWRIL